MFHSTKLLVGLAACSATLGYHINFEFISYMAPPPRIDTSINTSILSSKALAAKSIDIMSSYTSIGCYQDSTKTRMLRTYIASPRAAQDMTVETCATVCYDSGFPYAGLEYGQECFCDTLMQTLVTAAETDCNMACAGDSGEICGGDLRINIYSYSGAMPLTSTAVASPTTTTSSMTESANSAVTASAIYEYKGCYTDVTYNRTLGTPGSFPGSREAMTIEPCQDACKHAGYVLAGLEFGHECWCDNVIQGVGIPAPEADCNMSCNGNDSETCGGGNRIGIYSFVSTLSSTTASLAASSTSMSSRPSASFVSLGCYTDSRSNRTLGTVGDFPGAHGNMTIEPCQAACQNAHYYFAGLEFGNECWCDNVIRGIGVPAPDSDCDMPCTGSASETCGGSDRIDIYQLVLAPLAALPSAATNSSITVSNSVPICTEYYKVAQGDYCYKIWTSFEISQEQFIAWNPSLVFPQCQILVGQDVCVHQGSVGSGVTTVAGLFSASTSTDELAASVVTMSSSGFSSNFTMTAFTTTFETITISAPTQSSMNSSNSRY